LERRRQNLDWLVEIVRANPGVNLHRLIDAFSKETGLSRGTVIEYLKMLERAGYTRVRGFKVYPREERGL